MRTTRLAALAGLLLLVPTALAAQSPAEPGYPPQPDLSAARSVCEEKGGTVQWRRAIFGTNLDQAAWTDLGRTVELCRWQAEDGSRIYVDTITLALRTPTLAAVAYLQQVPMAEYDPSRGNPATAYCADLGGSASFGDGASGGGWVDTTDPDDPVIAMCVFPDGSMLDEWGLAYHSDGTIRGVDLEPLFVYQPGGDLPGIFSAPAG
ncbi:MAG: DUF333 domain-containing protein [Chloroflexi bacterium]|nr:DUF333 domain-containing protein [Chloroflexota bacterium]